MPSNLLPSQAQKAQKYLVLPQNWGNSELLGPALVLGACRDGDPGGKQGAESCGLLEMINQ